MSVLDIKGMQWPGRAKRGQVVSAKNALEMVSAGLHCFD